MSLADLARIPADARVYLRPTGFVDSPFGFDGQTLRLAGGLAWFSAVEFIVAVDGRRAAGALVAVDRLDEAMASLPGGQRERATATLARIVAPRPALTLGERIVRLDQPQVMAILNVTPDSFSDGGRHVGDPEGAAAAGIALAAQGAAIIDVGGESTRPRSVPVWEGDEIARTVPVVERLAAAGTAVSIDTRKAAVMAAAVAAGAHIINDVSALLYDARSLEVAASATCPIVLMHHRERPEPDQQGDVLIEVYDWLEARIAAAEQAGIARSRIIVDPGLGGGIFGKRVRDNMALLNGLSLLHGLGCPILLGASRKTFIGALSNEAAVTDRLGGSVTTALLGAQQGVQILRVHDVAETVQALRVWRGLRDEALTPR
ncbi:MAG: dihydropteroate synthase [Sphingomonas bacterium]|nr:dihydropteroate synthase [Sphingomonas bacterium]